jgi:uncharacterized protein YndB with AHSA1/START domain
VRVERFIEIAAPPEKVWTFLSKPAMVLEWYIPLQRFEYISEKQSVKGAPIYFEEKVAGRLMKLVCVVTESVENTRFAFKMTSGNAMKSYEEIWTIEPIPNGSKFLFEERGELPYGFIGKIIEPLAQSMSGFVIGKMLTKLKSLVEA